jgi:hypothetical protein
MQCPVSPQLYWASFILDDTPPLLYEMFDSKTWPQTFFSIGFARRFHNVPLLFLN